MYSDSGLIEKARKMLAGTGAVVVVPGGGKTDDVLFEGFFFRDGPLSPLHIVVEGIDEFGESVRFEARLVEVTIMENGNMRIL